MGNRPDNRKFELEALEPRIMLSGDGLAGASAAAAVLDPLLSAVETSADELSDTSQEQAQVAYDPAAQLNDIFDGVESDNPSETPAAAPAETGQGDPDPTGSAEAESESGDPAAAETASANVALFGASEDLADKASGALAFASPDLPSQADEMVETLRAANAPPAGQGSVFHVSPESSLGVEGLLVLGENDTLTGSGRLSVGVENHGVVSPGNSPGVQNVPTFTQGPDGKTIIEIAGTGGPGAPNGHDQINVSGLAELDGTLEIQLLNGFVPVAGDSFIIFTWGSRTGEFANWLGTAGFPGHPELAFRPTYNANNLTLDVVSTHTLVPAAETAIQTGLDQLQQVGAALDSVGEFAENIPLIGSSLGNLVDVGQAINDALESQLNTFLATLPRQSAVTAEIESWDGTTVAGFQIEVLGVLGHYGANASDPFWWEVNLTVTQTHLNQAVHDVTGAVLDAVFNPNPTVDVNGTLEFDFAFGYDTDFFVEIDDLTARATVNASGSGGFAFDLTPPGSPITLNVTNWSVDLDASVTATPDNSVLTSGRITSATLSDMAGGSINVADAFNLDEAGSVDAAFTLDGALSGFVFDYSGTHTIRIQSTELFSGNDPELTLEVDGSMELLGQTLSGVFTMKKTATETVVMAANVVAELNLGVGGSATRILRVENGSGQFLVLDDDLAGTASLTIAAGPDIPNLSISGTTLNLAFNTSDSAVSTIDGDTVDLPAGPYYRLWGNAQLVLTTPSATLTGDFVFEPKDTDANPVNGDEEVVVGVANLSFDFSVSSTALLQVTDGSGAFVITDAGVSGQTNATVTLNVPEVTLTGTFDVRINDTTSAFSARTVDVNGTPVSIPDLPAGPYLRVEGSGAQLTVLGIGLSGDFAFERQTTTTGGEEVVTVAVSNVDFDLGTLASNLLQVTNVHGAFIMTDAGVAGEAAADVTLNVTGVTLSGTFSLRLNNTSAAVNETVNVAGSGETIDVPAGPYLQVQGTGVTLGVFGISITGDFSFEQRESTGSSQWVVVRAGDVAFDFGTSLISASNGSAVFLFNDLGMAGQGSIDVTVSAFGSGWTQPFNWSFNNTGSPIDEQIGVGPGPGSGSGGGALVALMDAGSPLNDLLETLDLPSGPFNRLSYDPGSSFGITLTLGGQPQSFTLNSVVLMLVDADPDPDYVTVGVSGLATSLSVGPIALNVSGGTGALVIYSTGVAGKVTVSSANLSGASAVNVSATDLRVEFNSTGADVGPVTVSVSDDSADDVTIEFTGTYFHDYFAIAGLASVELTGFVTLNGNFRFEKSEFAANTMKVAVENLAFDLKLGSLTVASFHHGTGAFVITAAGFAGVADVEFDVGLVGMSGDISLEVNTTSAAVNTSVTTPSGTTNINLTNTEYLKICVNGYLHLGSVALPFDFCVTVDTVSGTVEFRKTSDNSLLLSIDSSGNITTGLSFDDFAAPGPFEFVSMLRQLLNWMDIFSGASVFNVEIPFTGGQTIGDFLNWSQLFLDDIYSQMMSVELQSRTLTAASSGTLAGTEFKLQLGSESAVTVNVSGAYSNWNDLVTLFNTALTTAGLAGRVEARINERDSTDPDDDLFVLALTPSEIAQDTSLNLVSGNDEFNGLGFGPADSDDATVDQVGIVTERYDTPGFIEALADLLADWLDDGNLNNSTTSSLSYSEAQQVYTYTVDLSKTYSTNVPFDFGGDLGDIAGADLSGELQIDATVGFHFTLGFDLGAREVPRVISSTLIPAPANGRISEDAHFDLFLDDDVTPTALTLTAASTATNNNLDDLAADLNTLFAATAYSSTNLGQLLYAQKAGSGLAISVINEDHDGDGQLGTVDEDTNSNGRLDDGEDLDGDGVLDRVEDLNGDGNLDNQLGLINRLTIRSRQDDVFATELGFGAESIEIGGTGYFQSSSNSTIKGLFVENAQLSASLTVTTPTPIEGSLRFGFVEISTSGGTVGTVDYDGTTPNPITASIGLQNAQSGDNRFYIADLMNGIEDANIGDFIDGPDFQGSFLARLPNISIGGGGFSLPLGNNPEVGVWIPDVNHLDYNPDPYDPTTNNQGIFLTYPDFGNLNNFSDISFADIIQALKLIADNLSELSAFSFLDSRLPFIDISINDMLDYASKFAEIVEAAASANSESLQGMITDLEDQIEQLFDLDPNVLSVSLDDGGIPSTALTTSGGVNGSAPSTTTIDPDGDNNGFKLESSLTDAADLNGTTIRIVGSNSINDDSATASWDASNKTLTIEINGGTTTTTNIISAINDLSGSPWTASKTADDDPLPGNQNSGEGTLTTTALKFAFLFDTGYANTFPLQLDLKSLVQQLVGTNSAVADFLDAVTTLIQVEGEATLTVSASAALTLEFGLDLTNPSEVHPFFYDTTGVDLYAKVLGTDVQFSAAIGSIVGIVIKDGTVTLDQDGNPDTDSGDGDKGASFRLGLRDNNGDNRHYFSENWFDFDNIDLHMEGGVSAVLPIYTQVGSSEIPLGSSTDDNGDGYPDNYLVVDIPDLVRIFVDTRAENAEADVRIPGGLNDLHIVRTSGDPDNFKVVFEEDAGVGSNASAAFADDTLTIQISSGNSTAQAVQTAVQGLGGFTVSFIDDDPSGANDGSGTVTVSKLILITPDLSSLFDGAGLCDIIDQHAGVLLDGLDSLLGTIEDGLQAIADSTRLPLIGNGFGGAADFISEFRNGLLRELRDAVNAAGSATAAIENAIKSAFWNTLGPDGLDILVDPDTGEALDPAQGYQQLDVSLDCEEGLVVNLRLQKETALVDTSENPIDFDIGVPGFGLEVDGNVKLAVGFDLKFGFGLNKEDGFYFDSSATASDPELRVYLEATIPGLSVTGSLAFLQLEVADDPDDPSSFSGQFVVDLMDPNGDGKLTFAEMTSSGTGFDDIVDANLEAVADINLDLAASFGGNTAFPRVLAEFHLDWSWDLQDGSSDPVVAFTNIQLDLGTFISDFLGPILAEIQKVTEPFQPIIDIATARLPVLSDLAGETITLLDLAEAFGLLEPSTVRFIENVIQVIDLINSLDGLGEGSILIPFGSFQLQDDGTGNRNKIQVIQEVAEMTADELTNAINNATGPGASSTFKSKSAGFVGDINSLDNFSIPVFDNPSELFNLFTGGSVRLVEWRMPTFKFEFTYIQKIPIYPPLYAQFGGRIGATIDIGFGYDTYGIQKYISSENKNWADILDGFYVIDFDANGNEQPELTLSGEIFAGASIDLLIVEAGVRGGIFATIEFDLNDVNDDGKVRVSEIISLAKQDPRCIFNIHGEMGLFLEAFLKIDLFFFSIDKTWRFAEITLFSFDITCPEPVLASKDGSGNLTLHIGTHAADREEIDTTDGAETIIVQHTGGTAGNEEVEVQWGDYKQTYDDVSKIIADGGQGDDLIDVRGVQSPAEISGGSGNDTIYLSDGAGSVAHGDEGNDTLIASSSENATGVTLYGDDGNDTLSAGSVVITIYGGAGNDTITGSPQVTGNTEDDQLFGDAGADTITGDDGNDHIEGGDGNDVIEGGAGNDYVLGGGGRDQIRGSRGDDILNGGDGDDEILGGSGNDLLVGGEGADLINGHGGIDLVIGDDYVTVNNTTPDPSSITALLEAIPTSGVSVEGLNGSGNDILIGGGNIDVLFGGEGDDLMYGGNFMNQGETEVIEEDHNDFFDGGPGNDTIFGDDSMGREGDRNTGIAIKSGVFYDNNLNGLWDDDEVGIGGVTVQLIRQSNGEVLATETTASDGSFEFVGLDPLDYRLKFSSVTGLTFAPKYAGGATGAEDASNDSDVDTGSGETDPFHVDYDETESNVAAGYQGNPTISIDDISVTEGNVGQVLLTFTVDMSGPAGSTLNIPYHTSDGSATAASGDYEALTDQVLTIPQGETTAQISVTVFSDSMYEEHEQFQLVLDDPFSAGTISALGTIVNDDPIPTLSIQDYVPPSTLNDQGEQVYTVAESDPATFVVSLSNPSQFAVTVEWRTDTAVGPFGALSDTAATPSPLAGADYTVATGLLTFEPGETNQVIEVEHLPDTLDEFDEEYYVDLFNPTFASIEDGRAYGIIADDDAPVSVSIAPQGAAPQVFETSVTEPTSGSTFVTLEIELSAASGKPITLTFATAPGTAVEQVFSGDSDGDGTIDVFVFDTPDYVAIPDPDIVSDEALLPTATAEQKGEITFEPGETLKTITVEVRGDPWLEPTEQFFVNLLSADHAVIAENAPNESNHVTIDIGNDDVGSGADDGPWSVRFSSSAYVVPEPDSGSTLAEITLLRTPGSSNAVVVLTVEDGTATRGADYDAPFRQLIAFGDNEYSRTIEIPVYADNVSEGPETVLLDLRSPTGQPARGDPNAATLTITDEDTPALSIVPPLFSLLPFQWGMWEGSSGGTSPHNFTVVLDAPAPAAGVQVDYETVSLTARSGEDFVATSGTVLITAGNTTATIPVDVIEDTMPELTEQFAVRLSNPVGATLAAEDTTAVANIFDDDPIEITGRVFYDQNGNGFRDFNEGGIQDVEVELTWYEGGVEQSDVETTDGNGIYKHDVFLGQVSIAVDGTTVTSPYQNSGFLIPLLGSGDYENTTSNENQSVEFEGVVGISPFGDVGYDNNFTLSIEGGSSDDVGRGGTDDLLFGGPGNDTLDAGAGDDHVVGGHWMTATDNNAPVNLGNYDAVVTVTNDPDNPETPASDPPLHNVYDQGPIFSVDTSGINANGSISGQIWLDANNNGLQDALETFAEEVLVNLYDCDGNPVNTVVTTDGTYSFTGLYLREDGTDSTYTVEFVLPNGYEFTPYVAASETLDTDVIVGGRTDKITLNNANPSATDQDAGVRESGTVTAPDDGSFTFGDPSFSVSESVSDGVVSITIVRGNTSDDRAVLVRTEDGTAHAGVNYLSVSALLNFDVGESLKTLDIPILDTDSLLICDTPLHFSLVLRDPTGRPLDEAEVYIGGDAFGNNPDDDTILGGGDWDVLIGDSGYIPAPVVIADAASLNTIVYSGGPGKDHITGGDGGTDPDFIDGQLEDDVLIGDGGEDIIRGGLGDDTIYVELDNKTVYGDHGTDTIVSNRDVPFIILTTTGPTTAALEHKETAGGFALSTFSLTSIEVAKLYGGSGDNTFDLTGWDGSAYLSGSSGHDVLEVENDTSMILKDASALEGILYLLVHGFFKDAAISLDSGATYHLGSLEEVTLRGGPSNNVLDASGFSRDVTLEGMDGNDSLQGGSGNDTFLFDADTPLGIDTVIGNGGIDTLDLSPTSANVQLDLSVLSPNVQVVEPASNNLQIFLDDLIENATGGDGNDTLTGNDFDNVLTGGPGNDSLAGGAGNETYVFDTDIPWGSETITESTADAGHDVIDFSGTTGQSIDLNLSILGSPQTVNANLTLTINGEGVEEVIGGSLNDTLRGNSNDNTLRGGPGNDLLDGKSGDDVLDGGAGDDDLNGGADTDTINETEDTDFILTDTSLTRASGEVDVLDNLEVANLTGGASANRFDISGWTGTGRMDGGDLSSTPRLDDLVASADADFTLTAGSLTISTNLGPITLASIDRVTLTGGPGDNQIDASGFSGLTLLSGKDGNDTILGGSGMDIIDGGLGNDVLSGNAGNDAIDGGVGSNTLIETRDAFLFRITDTTLLVDLTPAFGDEEIDTLAGIATAELTGGASTNLFDVTGWTAGDVTVKGEGGTDAVGATGEGIVTVTDTDITFTGGAGTIHLDSIETAVLSGGTGDDTLDASAFSGDAVLAGQEGDDTLWASQGSNVLNGGPGDDRFILTEDLVPNSVTVVGDDGVDTLDLSDFTAGVTVDLSITGGSQGVVAGDLDLRLIDEDVEAVVGGSGADHLTGNSLNNRLTGGAGADQVNGGAGENTVVEEADADFILTDASLDIGGVVDVLALVQVAELSGGPGANTLDATAFTGRAILNGAAGDDVLLGGSGNDVLVGGAGNDTLRGGDGNDQYRFDADEALGQDVLDEQPLAAAGTDLLDFSDTETVDLQVNLSLTSVQAVAPGHLALQLVDAGSIEGVIGGAQADTLIGNALDNAFIGGLGADSLDGGAGTNTLLARRDADFVLTDTTLEIDGEVDQLNAIQQAFLIGGAGNNTLDASAFTLGSVSLSGLDGVDVLIGGAGDDTLGGGEGNDQLFGNDGNDLLLGGNGDDQLTGGGGDDTLRGGDGNDAYLFDKSFDQGTDQLFENAGEGFADVILGLGLSGVDIDLFEPNPQWFYNDEGDLVLTLTLTVGTVEEAY